MTSTSKWSFFILQLLPEMLSWWNAWISVRRKGTPDPSARNAAIQRSWISKSKQCFTLLFATILKFTLGDFEDFFCIHFWGSRVRWRKYFFIIERENQSPKESQGSRKKWIFYSQAVPNTPYGQLFLIYLVKGFTFAYAFIIPLADHFVTGEQH